jgi:hypothetical protein
MPHALLEGARQLSSSNHFVGFAICVGSVSAIKAKLAGSEAKVVIGEG